MKLYKNLTTALKEREEVRAIKLILKDKQFPTQLFDLPVLEEAYLEGECASFPATIQGWDKLKVLSVKWETFSGDLSALFSLPSLENLKIIETPIRTFLLPLGKINAPLKFLTIKSCGLEKLPEEISMFTRLQEFYLPGNKLTQLPFAFKELKELKRLNLDSNAFTAFPGLIKSMKALGHLSIDGNSFDEDEKARIQRDFHIWPN
ncbi:MAG: leucine-rich repeat domain-containing protein [Bdellovibrionales bacterium]|nr:leucine-rich repeat domain-containing protein [Bdellovibrionales bacterium]